VAKSNNEKIRDDHWLVDFAVGRDFGLGNSNAQWKIGLRVADLRARLTASGTVATTGAALGPLIRNKMPRSSAPGRASALRARPR